MSTPNKSKMYFVVKHFKVCWGYNCHLSYDQSFLSIRYDWYQINALHSNFKDCIVSSISSQLCHGLRASSTEFFQALASAGFPFRGPWFDPWEPLASQAVTNPLSFYYSNFLHFFYMSTHIVSSILLSNLKDTPEYFCS